MKAAQKFILSMMVVSVEMDSSMHSPGGLPLATMDGLESRGAGWPGQGLDQSHRYRCVPQGFWPTFMHTLVSLCCLRQQMLVNASVEPITDKGNDSQIVHHTAVTTDVYTLPSLATSGLGQSQSGPEEGDACAYAVRSNAPEHLFEPGGSLAAVDWCKIQVVVLEL